MVMQEGEDKEVVAAWLCGCTTVDGRRSHTAGGQGSHSWTVDGGRCSLVLARAGGVTGVPVLLYDESSCGRGPSRRR